MRRRILVFSALLSAFAVLVTSALVMVAAYRDFYTSIKNEVVAQSSYIQSGTELLGMEYLQSIEHQAGHRLTLIAADGTVLFDTVADAAAMANHLDRPEVREALERGSGESSRQSDTIRKQTYYYALLLSDGSVLRMASTTNSLIAAFDNLIWLVALIAIGVFVIAFVIASHMTRRIVLPINELNLDYPEQNAVYDELTPLLRRMKTQNDQIQAQMQALDKQRAEFASITENMTEGFLVLDREARILSHNKSALRLLSVLSDDVTGQGALTLNRSESFRNAVDAALAGTARECVIELDGQFCQLLANPVLVDDSVGGAVLVLMDITEKQAREQLRREFTANVSHELKTPLTAISGYAEIITNGVAKPADVPEFAKEIYREAQRLTQLVQDLLLLSKLDESASAPVMEPVELMQLCKNAAERLRAKAEERNVKLSLIGEPIEIMGHPSVLDEMISNLIDNAIKYNRVGGTVSISLERHEKELCLSVSDSGIGIPITEQARVFERFYRVDKSHNEQVSGTGLGLAIVKHSAALHGARLSLESTVNVGTTISVIFRL